MILHEHKRWNGMELFFFSFLLKRNLSLFVAELDQLQYQYLIFTGQKVLVFKQVGLCIDIKKC